MENKKQEWYAQTAKYQTQIHTNEYTPQGKDTHKYTILEHEYVVLFDKYTGQHKVVKPDEIITNTTN
jgi:hypothetical protein